MDPTIFAAIISAGAIIFVAVLRWFLPPLLKRRRAIKHSGLLAQERTLAPTASTAAGVRTFFSREEAYRAVPEVIQRVNQEQKGTKHLLLAALHGHSGDRLVSRRSENPEFRSFDSALFQCVRSVGSEMWRVRELYSITSEDRLDEIVEWLKTTRDDDGYEVRAFCLPESIPHLAPLVIGNRDLFLGLEDPRYYRVQSAMHIQNADAARLATEYFNSLWNDSRAIVLRAAVGLSQEGIDSLRLLLQPSRK